MIIRMLFIGMVALGCTLNNENETKQMEKIEVTNSQGKIILKATVKENSLNGSCIWYNSDGEVLAEGIFKKGKPFEGTFLDWSLFFTEDKITYSPEIYCKDWVSIYESSFLSRKVDYSSVLVKYHNGKKESREK